MYEFWHKQWQGLICNNQSGTLNWIKVSQFLCFSDKGVRTNFQSS